MNPRDLSNDNDPAFIAEFHKNVKILTQAFYQLTSGATAPAPVTPVAPTSPMTVRVRTPAPSPGSSLGFTFEPLHIDNSASSVSGISEVQTSAITPTSAAAMQSVPPIPTAYFDRASMQERLKRYAAEGGISLEALDRYLEDARGRGASSGTTTSAGFMTPVAARVRDRVGSDADEKTRGDSFRVQSAKSTESEGKDRRESFERRRSLRNFVV